MKVFSKIVFLMFLFLINSFTLLSQVVEESSLRSLAYLEVGGPGLFSSLNYEFQVSEEPGFSLRAGLGVYADGDAYITYNSGAHFLFAVNEKQDAFLDLGVGVSLASEYLGDRMESSNRDVFVNIVPGLSYRKHFSNKTFFRSGINAVISDFGLVPWINLSIGKRF